MDIYIVNQDILSFFPIPDLFKDNSKKWRKWKDFRKNFLVGDFISLFKINYLLITNKH